jgi:hypothetical protein
MIQQLNPPIPLVTVDGRKCIALMVIDYGPDWDLLWVVGFHDSREIWSVNNSKLRLGDNISFGRMPVKDVDPSA